MRPGSTAQTDSLGLGQRSLAGRVAPLLSVLQYHTAEWRSPPVARSIRRASTAWWLVLAPQGRGGCFAPRHARINSTAEEATATDRTPASLAETNVAHCYACRTAWAHPGTVNRRGWVVMLNA